MATIDERTRTLHSEKKTSGEKVVLGLLLFLMGFWAILAAPRAGFMSVLLLGIIMIAAGTAEGFHGLLHRELGNRLLLIIGGVLSVLLGVLLVSRTWAGMAFITLPLAGYFIANGLIHGITAVSERYPRWALDAIQGLVSIVLGLLVVARWPASSLWLLGTLIGIEVAMRGAALISGGLEQRRLAT